MKEISFNRRYLLSALGATGVASATGFVGLAAGTKDAVELTSATTWENGLEFAWRETYNGNVVEQTSNVRMKPGEAVISLQDVLPGDAGTFTFRIRNTKEDASVNPHLSLDLTGAEERGRNEPERKAGDSSGTRGELQQFLDVKLWIDGGAFDFLQFGGQNATMDVGETLVTSDASARGSLADVAGAVNEVPLKCLATDERVTVSFSWSFNTSAGDVNVTQTDAVDFDFVITPELC